MLGSKRKSLYLQRVKYIWKCPKEALWSVRLGRCFAFRQPEDGLLLSAVVCIFTFLAWQYIFLSRVCLVSWFTQYDNCTSAIVCLHLYVVICTVITKSKAKIGTLIRMSVILLIECEFSNRSLLLLFFCTF